jgi:hypothetical protein
MHGDQEMTWSIRPYDDAVYLRDLVNPHPRSHVLDPGDEAVLHIDGDETVVDVFVRVIEIRAGGDMTGTISRANRPARHDGRLAKGAAVEFVERNVYRFAKATT